MMPFRYSGGSDGSIAINRASVKVSVVDSYVYMNNAKTNWFAALDVTDFNMGRGYVKGFDRYISDEMRQFFQNPPGQDHYEFLGYIATHVADAIIVDIGSHQGTSAVALSVNPKNIVYSFDVENRRTNPEVPFNVQFVVLDLLPMQGEEYDTDPKLIQYWELLEKASVVCIDVNPHDGIKEPQFMQLLKDCGFKGVSIWDDIRLNDPMKAFWNGIDLPKADFTGWGHWSGTGIVYHATDYCTSTEPVWNPVQARGETKQALYKRSGSL